jgi:prepilin-type N-terminal cleavage/methylation domain-containing protein/prepilin-type processing-associated H-X9-DG protein
MQRSTIQHPRSTKKGFSLIELLVAITIIAILAGFLAPALRSAKESGNSAKCLSNLRQLYLANSLYAESHNGFFALGAEDIWTTNLKRWHGERTTTADPFDPSKSPLVNYLGKDGKVKVCPSLRDYIATGPAAYESGGGGYGYNHNYIGGRVDMFGLTPANATRSLSLNDNKAWNLSKFAMFADCAIPSGSSIVEESFIYPPFWQLNPDPTPVSNIPTDPTVHFRHNDRANVVWCDGHASSEKMSFTTPSNSYGGDNNKYKVGWFGPRVDNAYWKSE